MKLYKIYMKTKSRIVKIPGARTFLLFIKGCFLYTGYLFDYIKFYINSNKSKRNDFSLNIFNAFPCLFDNTKISGFDPHYLYHTAWAMRVVRKIDPKVHIDISSTLNFCTLLSAFVPVDFYDYRPAHIELDNLNCLSGDLMSLPFATNSVESISCMHVLEHIGLGRYGDPIDPWGDVKAINELKRVTAVGGNLIVVFPVGKPMIAFNAHRIYSFEQISKIFSGFDLKEFSLIPDNANEIGIIKNADPELVKKQDWACGCFWFIKKS